MNNQDSGVLVESAFVEKFKNWNVRFRVDKYRGNFKSEAEAILKGAKPFESIEGQGNLLLNEGINELWNIACGTGSPTVYSNANARIGVGDSATAAAASQTDLQGTNKTYKAMDATYPTAGSPSTNLNTGFFRLIWQLQESWSATLPLRERIHR